MQSGKSQKSAQSEKAQDVNIGMGHNEGRESVQGQEASAAEKPKQEQTQEKEGKNNEECLGGPGQEAGPKVDSPEQRAGPPSERVAILLPSSGLEVIVPDAVVEIQSPAPDSGASPSTLISSLYRSELRSPRARGAGEKGSSQGTRSQRGDVRSPEGEGTIQISSFDGWEMERE